MKPIRILLNEVGNLISGLIFTGLIYALIYLVNLTDFSTIPEWLSWIGMWVGPKIFSLENQSRTGLDESDETLEMIEQIYSEIACVEGAGDVKDKLEKLVEVYASDLTEAVSKYKECIKKEIEPNQSSLSSNEIRIKLDSLAWPVKRTTQNLFTNTRKMLDGVTNETAKKEMNVIFECFMLELQEIQSVSQQEYETSLEALASGK